MSELLRRLRRPAEPIWISRNLLDAIHTELIKQYGGSCGVADEQRIDAALAHPKRVWNDAAGIHLAKLAGSVAYGILYHRGYRDGNKRTALATAAVFLRFHGFRLVAPEIEAVAAMVYVATGVWDEQRASQWMGEHVEMAGRKRL